MAKHAKQTTNPHKLIALLVSVAMSVNLSVMSFAASVVDIDTANATHYEDGQLQSAIDDAQARGEKDDSTHTVTLITDETVKSALEINSSLELDLNGKQLALAEGSEGSLIKIEANNAIDVTITSSATTDDGEAKRGELSGGTGSQMDFSDLGDTGYYGTYGGAIQITDLNTSDESTQIKIENVTITGNTADFGGGIYATSTTSESSKNGSITISNSEISDNTANSMGGAVEIVGFEQVTITDTAITDNITGSADNDSYDTGYGTGGSLVLDGIQNATIANSTISDNTADGIYSWGGGLYTEDSDVTITDTTISDNKAAWGGGILGVRSDIELKGTTTVANNTASSAGDDVYFINMAGGYSESNLTLNTATGTLKADDKAIDGWYVDGVQGDATLRWSETDENFEDGYYAKQDAGTLQITGNLALKAAHDKQPAEEITPDPDEKDPDGGNTDPDGGNTDPDNGNTDPDNGNTDPDNGNTDPDNGNTDPDNGNTDPDNGNTAPDNGNTAPDNGNTDPDGGNTDPDNGNTAPDNGNTDPDNGNTVPDNGNTAPDNGNTAPDNGNTAPDNGNTAPDNGNTEPAPETPVTPPTEEDSEESPEEAPENTPVNPSWNWTFEAENNPEKAETAKTEQVELTEVEETETPLEELPEDLVELPDEEIPLAELPEEDVPLSETPRTGDTVPLWAATALVSALGVVFFGKRRREQA